MKTFNCAQRGCEFEAQSKPDDCPVCHNPFIGSDAVDDDEAPWTEYTIGELREVASDWGIEGWNSRTKKAELIELLEAAEADCE